MFQHLVYTLQQNTQLLQQNTQVLQQLHQRNASLHYMIEQLLQQHSNSNTHNNNNYLEQIMAMYR